MNAIKFITAAAAFAVAGSVFAADAPAANAAVTAAAASTAAAAANANNGIAAKNLNVPSIVIGQPTAADRAAVRTEAVEFVKNHKTALAVQLEQYKN
ncbi:hypothetical protein [Massilia cavernae]|uniref:DUF4148 domain-containing protein n=1 Tax=Massilia cavernae TaxID=2320864 RepID=A0A418Y567_9BURK|nr:hypothetical protein [Massilia cavernae]RJG21391.1 hypothetical protein D3872_06785 [Massilia cavernae]